MNIDSSWDITKYKIPYEPGYQWELKRQFMELNKDKVPEDKLVCLAQALANSEFLGCRYPSATMELIEKLSQGIIQEFRERRKKILKRTLVSSSDAANSKVNRVSRDPHIDGKTRLQMDDLYSGYKRFVLAESPDSVDTEKPTQEDTCSKSTESSDSKKECPSVVKPPTESQNPKSIIIVTPSNLKHPEKLTSKVISAPEQIAASLGNSESAKSSEDPFSDFVFLRLAYSEPDRGWTILQRSGSFCGAHVELTERGYLNETSYSVLLNGKVVSRAVNASRLEARAAAIEEAISILRKKCYTIVVKTQFLTDGNVIDRDEVKKATDQKIDASNVGHKLLQMMGWTGGGLGRNQEGIAEPVAHKTVYRREGLGAISNMKDFSSKIGKVLQNFKKSHGAHDLVFSSGFSNLERAQVHRVARRCGLKSKSFGKGEDRFVTVSFKITGREIIEQLKQNGGCSDKYELLPPGHIFEDSISS